MPTEVSVDPSAPPPGALAASRESALAETVRRESLVVVEEVLERLRVLIVAGVIVGVVVAGAGSRLAMLALRLTSSDNVIGVTSDDGFTIGKFTLSGTYNLLVIGAAVGMIGAAAYRAVAPWLLGPSWFRRFTTGAASGAVVGSMLVHDDGIDFHFLTPTWFAIGLFIALPALFGVTIGMMVDRVAAPGSWTAIGRRRWALPVILLVLFPPAAVIAVVAVSVLVIWVPVRRWLVEGPGVPLALGMAVRVAWLAVAVAGLVALLGDIRAIT